jgi:dipeptidyl aminopeptidase/acylaminoacyl peptidase
MRRLILLLMTVFPLPLLAQTRPPAEKWTAELSMKYRSIGGVDLSPDGRLVAYSIREPVMEGEKSEYRTQVWIAATDGSRNVQYTRGETSSDGAQFSPDGQSIAFTSSRSGKSQVWLLRIDGGEAEQITDQEDGVGSFRFSPDGTRIAYTLSDPKTEEEKKADKEKRDVILVDQNFKFHAHLACWPALSNVGSGAAVSVSSGVPVT